MTVRKCRRKDFISPLGMMRGWTEREARRTLKTLDGAQNRAVGESWGRSDDTVCDLVVDGLG